MSKDTWLSKDTRALVLNRQSERMGACVSKDTWEPAPAPAVLPPKPKPPSNGPSDAIEPFQRAGTVEEHDEDASSFCSVARLGGE
eukprot:scaffold289653_cov17-Tisochrysis_lutea.AAC.1